MDAAMHMREALSLSYGSLMKATREKVETNAVLSEVCKEARDMADARNSYAFEAARLNDENTESVRKIEYLVEMTGKASDTLNARNEEARKNRAEVTVHNSILHDSPQQHPP